MVCRVLMEYKGSVKKLNFQYILKVLNKLSFILTFINSREYREDIIFRGRFTFEYPYTHRVDKICCQRFPYYCYVYPSHCAVFLQCDLFKLERKIGFKLMGIQPFSI